MDISRKIRELRAKQDLTLEAVGAYVGVSKATVQRWESGDIKNMRRDKIAKLAEVLGTTPGELVGWTDSPEEEPVELPSWAMRVSPHERTLLEAYRANPAMQPAVNRLLNIPDEAK